MTVIKNDVDYLMSFSSRYDYGGQCSSSADDEFVFIWLFVFFVHKNSSFPALRSELSDAAEQPTNLLITKDSDGMKCLQVQMQIQI